MPVSDGLMLALLREHQSEMEDRIQEISSFVESQIELDFLAALLFMYRDDVYISGEFDAGDFIPRHGILVCPQYEIGKYRVDFLIVSIKAGEFKKHIVVECDGHDFHERTKEQAERDRSRDRHITSMGIDVFRFTGREIHRDAIACAVQTYDHVWKKGKAA